MNAYVPRLQKEHMTNVLLHMCHSLREDDNLDAANEAEDKDGASHIAAKAGIHLFGILQGGRRREKRSYQWGVGVVLPEPEQRGVGFPCPD